MTNAYDFNPETIKTIMAGLKPEIRLNENGVQETYMVPKDNATDEQIQEAVTALKHATEIALYMDEKIYNDNTPAIEILNRMGQPTMYRGSDLQVVEVIDELANAMKNEQNKIDMDIIKSVYNPVIDGDNIRFEMLERQNINHSNVAKAVQLLDHHFNIKINTFQDLPVETKAYRNPVLDVPPEYAKYAIEAMTPQQTQEQPSAENIDNPPLISPELDRKLTEAYEATKQQTQEDTEENEHTPPYISKEMEESLNAAYEALVAKRKEMIKQIAAAYDVSQTEREGTYFRPKDDATAEELAAGEQALRELTEEKMKDKRLSAINTIVPMGSMNGPKMFRALGENTQAVFAEIGQEVETIQQEAQQLSQTSPIQENNMTTFVEAEPENIQLEPETPEKEEKEENETKPATKTEVEATPQDVPLTMEEKAWYEGIKIAAELDKNFIIVAGNLRSKPGVSAEKIAEIKQRMASILDTKEIIENDHIIGLEPINQEQVDIIFPMIAATKSTREILDRDFTSEKDMKTILNIFNEQVGKLANATKTNRIANINGTSLFEAIDSGKELKFKELILSMREKYLLPFLLQKHYQTLIL